MRPGYFMPVILIIVLIAFLSFLDIIGNVFGFIPVLGDVLETVSETVLETIQITLAGILGLLAIKGGK